MRHGRRRSRFLQRLDRDYVHSRGGWRGGRETWKPQRNGFVVAGLVRDMNTGIALAREQIDSGSALQKLRALQSYKPNDAA